MVIEMGKKRTKPRKRTSKTKIMGKNKMKRIKKRIIPQSSPSMSFLKMITEMNLAQ